MTDSKPISAIPPATSALARIFAKRRLKVALGACLIPGLFLTFTWKASYLILYGRLIFIGLSLLLVYGVVERWPRELPSWMARWALQVVAVAIAVPFVVAIAYAMTTFGSQVPWYKDAERMTGYSVMTIMGLLITPWVTVTALLNQIKDEARNQALSFQLERSNFERQALDARLRLLQAQVEPHFLFNTLANVRELVVAGSPRASAVLDSLIAYLRAAVPRLQDPSATLGQELDLVRAYLEVMHMRMPDRLTYSLDADAKSRDLAFPAMALLTLVENAMHHGIDPAEDGGRIDIRARVGQDCCCVTVRDTGIGLKSGEPEQGTGLANLRERLALVFGNEARLRLVPVTPHGLSAELDFPALKVAT